MTTMKSNQSDLDRAFDAIINRIVTPILKHRDAICRSEGWNDELSKALVTNQVISEMRETAKKELAAIYFGTCEDLQAWNS
jgi:hypothetical protein